jgi:hypothetical protein
VNPGGQVIDGLGGIELGGRHEQPIERDGDLFDDENGPERVDLQALEHQLRRHLHARHLPTIIIIIIIIIILLLIIIILIILIILIIIITSPDDFVLHTTAVYHWSPNPPPRGVHDDRAEGHGHIVLGRY